jgi:hypothetical protein
MDYPLNFTANIEIKNDNYNLKSLTFLFLSSLLPIFEKFVSEMLMYHFERLYASNELAKLLGVMEVKKKTSNKTTYFKVFFGKISVPQIQVRVIDFEGRYRQMSITRILLGVSPMLQIPDFMKEIQAWIGAITTFRVGHNIMNFLTGFTCSLTSSWNAVKWHASRIKSGLNKKDGTNEFETDGTGIPTKEGGKRGSEFKVIFQRLKNGKLHFCGASIGKYKNKEDWFNVLFPVLSEASKRFKKVILASDADKTIMNTAKSIGKNIFIQMDKWHVFHQLKYYLWQDGVDKNKRSKIIEHFYKITMLFKTSIKTRDRIIKFYIFFLSAIGLEHTATYLKTAMEYFYTHEAEGNNNTFTSKTERSMRTTNQRINVGKWSKEGSLSVLKIRLEYYYNGRSPLNWQK